MIRELATFLFYLDPSKGRTVDLQPLVVRSRNSIFRSLKEGFYY